MFKLPKIGRKYGKNITETNIEEINSELIEIIIKRKLLIHADA